MKPLFTIHEGEFLVGEYITRKLKDQYDVYVPVKDRGIDLLVTQQKKKRTLPVGIQVKFSRGFDARHGLPEEHAGCAAGWYTLNPAKVRKSPADLWIFVILTLRHEKQFIIVPTSELKRRMPSRPPSRWHLYITVWKDGRCFNTRGLKIAQVRRLLDHGCNEHRRDYTEFLNNWDQLDFTSKGRTRKR